MKKNAVEFIQGTMRSLLVLCRRSLVSIMSDWGVPRKEENAVLELTYHKQLDPLDQVLHIRDHHLVPPGPVVLLSVSDGVAVQSGGHVEAFDDVERFPQP